jgi:hypothetical protein
MSGKATNLHPSQCNADSNHRITVCHGGSRPEKQMSVWLTGLAEICHLVCFDGRNLLRCLAQKRGRLALKNGIPTKHSFLCTALVRFHEYLFDLVNLSDIGRMPNRINFVGSWMMHHISHSFQFQKAELHQFRRRETPSLEAEVPSDGNVNTCLLRHSDHSLDDFLRSCFDNWLASEPEDIRSQLSTRFCERGMWRSHKSAVVAEYDITEDFRDRLRRQFVRQMDTRLPSRI